MNAHKTILVVDDDRAVRRFVLDILRRQGCHTVEAFDGESGLAMFVQHQEQIDLVITDVSMPNGTGPEMVDKIRTLDPSARVVFISGNVRVQDLPPHLREFPILEKPFKAKDLVRFVHPCVPGTDLSESTEPLVELI